MNLNNDDYCNDASVANSNNDDRTLIAPPSSLFIYIAPFLKVSIFYGLPTYIALLLYAHEIRVSLALLLFMIFYDIWHYEQVPFLKFFLLVASKTIISAVYCFISFYHWHLHCGSFVRNFSSIHS